MADPYLAVEYTMYGAREAMNGGMPHIEQHIVGIERAIVENPGYAFDLAKALVESVCKVILDERSVTYASGDDLPQLFRAVTLNLPLLPASASGETQARNSLQKTLNGLHTAIQGICELRNNYGFASHGTSRHGQVMESVQALLAAQAADSIVGFLHQVHAQDRARLPAANLEHRHNPEFNDYVDEANEPVRVFELIYTPSEVLFVVDYEAYKDLLANYTPDEPVDVVDTNNVASAETVA